MPQEGLTIFAHLGSQSTDMVAAVLARKFGPIWDGIVYDVDAGLLMTTSDQAKGTLMAVLEELGLLPIEERRLF